MRSIKLAFHRQYQKVSFSTSISVSAKIPYLQSHGDANGKINLTALEQVDG